MKYDFGGYATRNDLECSDGRTIRQGAFKDQDGVRVPLVWQHKHDDPGNVLGHADLENREDGVYAYCKFNDTESAKVAQALVKHGDIRSLSIYANKLMQKGKDVLHGVIREVSLVLAGANPGAYIESLVVEHSDGSESLTGECIAYFDEEISFEDLEHADTSGDMTVEEVFDTMNEDQKTAAIAMMMEAIAAVKGESAEHSDEEDEDETIKHSDKEETLLKKNIFEGSDDTQDLKKTLTHDEFSAIMADAENMKSFRQSFIKHTQEYGIENIDILFPDAKTVTPTPDFIKRDMDWVPKVLNGARHTPFSRIKSTAVDITADEARALGYIKGNLKKEEVIRLLKRVTGPTTIYKKQRLDRDDIIDITDLDIVAFLRNEMRMMLDEEIARAVLIGDGRDAESEDKINEDCIRPIYKDDDLYAHHVTIPDDGNIADQMEAIIRNMEVYEGSGSPTLFTTYSHIIDMLLLKDSLGHRYYRTESEIAAALGVGNIIKVPLMKGLTRTDDKGNTLELLGIVVNMRDYTIGADKGGQIATFDDFDIDYNQYKYLIETRISGCLTHPKSALVIELKKTTTPTPTPSKPGDGGDGGDDDDVG